MAYITTTDVNAWLEPTKLTLDTLDEALEDQVSEQIISRLAAVFDVSGWTTSSNTPSLVRSIIAMEYAAWVYDKSYSDDAESNAYAALLRQRAEQNIDGILSGFISIAEVDPNPATEVAAPVFFPNDLSSSQDPTSDNPSDGGPAFLMGTVF